MELGSLLSVSGTFLWVWGPEMSESSEETGMSEHEYIRFSLLFTVMALGRFKFLPWLPRTPGDAICELP